MAAEAAARAGVRLAVFEGMPSCGRKFLLAGKGGLNLTHSEHRERLLERYAPRRAELEAAVRAFDADALRAWAADLGVETFVGSSGRVFPGDGKAAPLLRRWLRRLRAAGVSFHLRHRWQGWNADRSLRFSTPAGEIAITAAATVLALGGASWPQLGADGGWVETLRAHGVEIAPLQPANCGFDCAWSEHLRTRWAGAAVKPVVVSCTAPDGHSVSERGEFIVTASGVEGGVIYALSRHLRDALARDGVAVMTLDLAPDRSAARLTRELELAHGTHTLAHHLKRRAGIDGVKVSLLQEICTAAEQRAPAGLAGAIKALPLRLVATRPLAEAISTAGGVSFAALTRDFMLHTLPGVFCAGEMLDWETTTGGYLLTACFATGRAAGAAAAAWMTR